MARTAPSFAERHPASERASAAARGSSKKTDTACEVLLRRALWRAGLRFRKDVRSLAGKPDIVFPGARVVVFCDGDFWHGRDWDSRRQKLLTGNNPDYWIAKISRNIDRDRRNTQTLEQQGWKVIRVWEGDILQETSAVAAAIMEVVRERRSPMGERGRGTA